MRTHTHICFCEICELNIISYKWNVTQHHKFHLNVKTNDATHTPRKYENDYYLHNELCIKNRVRPKKKEKK